MSFLRKVAAFVRHLSIRSPEGWPVQISASGEVVNARNVLGLSAAWACVNLLSGTIATLPVDVYRGFGKSRVPMPQHPLYRLLHDSPNEDQTAVDFWGFMGASIELWGNAYAAIERIGSKVTSLTSLPPDAVYVTRLETGRLLYRWTYEGKSFESGPSGMLHIRGPFGNPLGGISTLSAGANCFGLAQATDRAAAATFRNSLTPPMAITFEKFLTATQREFANAAIDGASGSINAGRPLLLEGGTKVQVLSLKPEDAQMLQTRGFSVEEICRFFGVPPFMVGHTEKTTSWGTGLEQQVLGFQKFSLRQRVKRIEQACMKQLLTPADVAMGVQIELNMEGLLRADTAARSAFYTAMLNAGVFTINEVRELENMPPVKGGDVPRMQSQNVPITQTGPQQQPALEAA